MMNQYIDIHPDVEKALNKGEPVVALESTIISHGMPYPQNVDMALNVENIIKEEGAVPATIAILNGRIKVGLTKKEIKELATAKNVSKVSKRDFAYVISQKRNGATTVSGTALVAQMVGIKIFATGGIGGVHRGAESTFDISRDLEEVSLVDVAIVCAGAKSILDLGLTLEYLETKGVEIIGYQTQELPAFFSRESGFQVDYQLNSPEEIASLLHAKWTLGLTGGIIVANPIPKPFSMDSKEINQAIDQAIDEAKINGIKGNEVTPYLLSKIKDMTEGSSLESNLELVYNNARLAAKIACAYTLL